MFETLGNHSQRERLHTGDSLVPVLTVGHDAGQGGYLGQPTAIDFAFDFNRERHSGNVAFGPAV